MLLDSQNTFSDKQAITTSCASTNIIKAGGEIMNEISYGTPVPLIIQVVEDFAGLTSLKVALQTSETENFATPVSLYESGAVALADLQAGYRFPLNYIPKGNLGYLRLYYTVVGTATAGAVTAGITAGNDNSFQDM